MTKSGKIEIRVHKLGGDYMHVELYITIEGEIDSKELYRKLLEFEPCVIDMGAETYVCIATGLHEEDTADIVKLCKEYGECDVDIKKVPITL